ncbi:MAG: helix-turn-helix domain-containing protein [Actinobacteria bacterium]|nr:helix-turn-helix domain-containing protein [Actinomycetota bacterium]MBM4102032.1 helix-turn-helix domain-containing protein [Phycisphaerae bacterium]
MPELRSRRQRLQPQHVGLPDGPRRRTTGLRREEVAELASISTDWYTRIEQGRPVTPSPETLDSLARALRLTDTEHAHLRALAAHADGHTPEPEVPDDVRRVVHAMTQPAYVTGPRWEILDWNQAANDLFGFSRVAAADRNTLVLMLTRPVSRELFGDRWAAEAQRMIAQFRATCDLMAGDPTLHELIDRLTRQSPEFARRRADQCPRRHQRGRCDAPAEGNRRHRSRNRARQSRLANARIDRGPSP